jgi:hypothetical protein
MMSRLVDCTGAYGTWLAADMQEIAKRYELQNIR